MKVRFTKIRDDHDRLRDDVIEGETDEPPEVGKRFSFVGPPRDIEVGFRHVNTSVIASMVKNGNRYTARTQNGSVYEIEIPS